MTSHNQYDIFGNLLEEDATVGMTTTTTRYAYDGWNPAKAGATGTSNFDAWAVFNSLGSLTSRQLQGDGIDQHLAYVQSSNAYWYLTDHLGSTRAVVDNSGKVQDSLVYDAYGNITYQTPSPATSPLYSYTGRELDVETGLQYNRARWYDANTGRWISQDPMGFDAGDSNLYRYVHNQPTIGTDPSGLLEVDDRPNQRRNMKLVDVAGPLQNGINAAIGSLAGFAKTGKLAAWQFVDLVYQLLGEDQPGTGVKLAGLKEVSMVAKIAALIGGALKEKGNTIARIPFSESRYHKVPLATWTNLPNLASDTTVWGAVSEGAYSGLITGLSPLGGMARLSFSVGDAIGGTILVNTDATAAEKASFLTLAKTFMPSFAEGLFGWASTGIASRADINANNDGFSFYGKLWSAYKNWSTDKNAGAFPAVFKFSDYKVANWNEQNVPNKFNPYVSPWVDDQWALG